MAEESPAAAGSELGEITPEERRALSIWRQTLRDLEGKLTPPGLDDVVNREAARLKSQINSATLRKAVIATIERREREGRKPRTIEDLDQRLTRFQKDLGVDRIVGTITTADIDGWLRSLKLGPQSKINFRRALHALFNECVKHGWCQTNPVTSAEKPKEPEREIGFLTHTDATKLLLAATDDVLPGIALQLFCGLREAELVTLHWEQVNLAGGHIRIITSKTGKRLVPIPDNARQWLQPVAKTEGNVWDGSTRYHYSHSVRGAFDAAGVKRTTNCLRHSFCTYRLAASQDLAKTSLEAGNSPRMIQKHYAELVGEDEGKR
ncbi:MAG: tyrosine-type recombinase/integrase, partial [Verrucomicrobiales bacterium]|nr:tyrosine-type recombinase/integrase [Verrucomicrobiales bacterium]